MVPEARRQHIREVTRLVERCGVQVRVAPEPVPVWEATERASGLLEPPPFWAHAWPGSVALAEWLRASPELVRGLRVLDFAAGGGVAGLVARQLGAAHVLATELDPWAVAAIEVNAEENHLEVEASVRDVVNVDDGWHAVLVGDVFYEAEPSRLIFAWLEQLHRRGALVAIGDPGRSFLPRERLRQVFTSSVAPVPAWDSVVDRPARVWQMGDR